MTRSAALSLLVLVAAIATAACAASRAPGGGSGTGAGASADAGDEPDAAPGGMGGSVDPGDSVTACVRHSDCLVVPTKCCACGPLEPDEVMPLRADRVNELFAKRCGPIGCPEIACPIPPRRYIATCGRGRCSVVDLHEHAATTCRVSSDCKVRTSACCECNGSIQLGDLVAYSNARTYDGLVCESMEGCDDCLPSYPPEVTAQCTAGHCTLNDPRAAF